jgi:DNA-binding winged helix-turn-helix (wHTH) protein/TolB-like protein/tetratricopeptide (TPR) repeat protein
MAELPAGVRPKPDVLLFADCKLDLSRGRLFRAGEEIHLRPKSFEVLCYLAQHAGRVVGKNELIEAVWPETAVTENSLVQCLLEIRKALKDDGQRIIRTVSRRGYMMDAAPDAPAVLPESQIQSQPEVLPQRTRVRPWAYVAAALLIAAAAIGAYLLLQPAPPPVSESLAVLPFRSLTPESPDILELGITDALITRLSLVRDLAVRPWASIQLYIGTNKDPVQAGRELRVESVLDGTLQKTLDRVRVTARLYRVRDGNVLWSGAFDENVDDIFTVQDSISEKVAAALSVKLGRRTQPRVNPEAFEAYVRGRYFYERFTLEGNLKAIDYFERAIKIEPNFALAHAGLAVNYSPMLSRGFISAQDGLPKMKQAVDRALALDDMLPEAHLAMAAFHVRSLNWGEAERFYKRAIELNPNYLHAWGSYAFFLHGMGRHEEGLAASRKELEIDPVSDYASKDHANSLIWVGRYEEALVQARKAVELRPDFGPAQQALARIYYRLNRLDDAYLHYMKGDDAVSAAWIEALQGDPEPARKLIEEIRSRPGSHLARAGLHAALGQNQQALDALDEAYEARSPRLLYVAENEQYAPLRAERRFRDLVARLDLPQRW